MCGDVWKLCPPPPNPRACAVVGANIKIADKSIAMVTNDFKCFLIN